LRKNFSQSAVPAPFSPSPILSSPISPPPKLSQPTSSQTRKKDMKQLTDILNLSIATIFNQLDIGRAIEIPPSRISSSLSELKFFLYQDNSKIAFKFEELKFFDPELSEKYSTGDLIYSDKNTIYRNVHLFIERIRNIIKIKILIIV
jgi:hypothetical protein